MFNCLTFFQIFRAVPIDFHFVFFLSFYPTLIIVLSLSFHFPVRVPHLHSLPNTKPFFFKYKFLADFQLFLIHLSISSSSPLIFSPSTLLRLVYLFIIVVLFFSIKISFFIDFSLFCSYFCSNLVIFFVSSFFSIEIQIVIAFLFLFSNLVLVFTIFHYFVLVFLVKHFLNTYFVR